MANTFQVKRSAVPGKAPATSDLALGEIAINTHDGKLFIKKNVSGTETIIDVTAGGLSGGDILALLAPVDGSGSGLDADLLDGLDSTHFLNASNLGSGTLNAARLPNSGVTAGTYGSSTNIPVLTVDVAGRVTAASQTSITVGNGTLTVNTSGVGLSGTGTFTANQTSNNTITITSNATNLNTASTVVARDASGNFTAGTITAALSGNASTATTLQNTRTINGTNFNGSANITTANWGTTRTLTIGSTGKSVNGSANVAWTLAEIGAAAAAHGHDDATTSVAGFMSATDKTKLDGIAAGAQVNVATNLGYTSAASTGTVTSSTGTSATLPAATTSVAGLLTSADKTKLDGIAAGAQVNVATNLGYTTAASSGTVTSSTGANATLPAATTSLAGLLTGADKTKLDGIATGATANTGTVTSVAASAGTGISISGSPITTSGTITITNTAPHIATDLTYTAAASTGTVNSSTGTNVTLPAATTSAAGLLTSADKTKLDGIAAGAQVNVATDLGITGTGDTRTITSSTGTNVTIPVATTTTAGWLSTADKTKLDGIAAGAQVNVATNLGYTTAASTGTVTSSTGTNATLPAATTSLAGLMTGTDKTKLDGIAAGAQVNVATNLSVTGGTTAGPVINSSTGTGVTLPTASGTASGVVTTGAQTFAGVKTFSSTISGSISGSAASLTTARTLTIGSTGKTFDGTANVSWSLAEIGAAAASHTHTLASLTDTSITSPATGDVLYYNGVSWVNVDRDTAGLVATTGNQTVGGVKTFSSTITGSISGNAGTATALQTARTIGGVSFNGTANINLPGVNTAGNQSTSGNAATATTLQTARTINGTSFNGSANITTANWGTARTLSFTGDVTGSASVNGSANVATAMTLANSGVTAGTFTNATITVDAKGRVTSASSGTAGGLTITDDTATNAERFLTFTSASSGSVTGANVSSTKLTFNPSTGSLTASGTISANSDIRLKDDIELIRDALSKVGSLRGVTFTRNDLGGLRQTGVIAQEVERVLPEAVSGDDLKSVAYGNMVGLLIEAIKELAGRVEELEAR